jgi:excisionase family DNA binding protein
MEKRFFSVKEISFYLSLHEVTIRRLIDQGKIPASKVGRSVRIDRKALDAKLERQEEK